MAIVDPNERPRIVDPLESRVPELSTAEPMTLWDRAKNLFRDPEAEGARAVQALVDAEALGIRPSAAYRYRDAIDRGEKINPTAAGLRSTLTDRVKQSWDTGVKQNQMGELGYKYVMTGDPRALQALQAIKLPTEAETFIAEGRLESAVRSAAKLTPMMLDTAGESTAKGLKLGMGFGAIAALAGQAGPQVAAPEEIITVPLATLLGFKLGATEGAFESSLRKEAGLAVGELMQMTDSQGQQMNPNTARAAAFGVGALNAGIEVAQLRTLLKAFPGLDRLVSQSMLEAATSKTVLQQLAGLARRYAGTVTTETGQEVAQESVNIVFEELAKAVDRNLDGTDFDPASVDDIVERLKATAVESAQGFSVIALPGAVASAAGIRAPGEASEVQPGQPGTEAAPEPGRPRPEAPAAETVTEADLDEILETPDEEVDAVLDRILDRLEAAPEPPGARLEQFREQLGSVVGEDEVGAVSAILEARARAAGMTPDEYLEYHNLVVEEATEEEIQAAEQQAEEGPPKAKISFPTVEDNRTVIRAFEAADVSSMAHELGHVFRQDLGVEDLAAAEDWAGVTDGQWTVEAEEKFARGFERYLADGTAPSEQLRTVFEQFKQWLLEIYLSIRGSSIDVQLTPEIRQVFDRLFESDANRVVEEFLQQAETQDGQSTQEIVDRYNRIRAELQKGIEEQKEALRRDREEIDMIMRGELFQRQEPLIKPGVAHGEAGVSVEELARPGQFYKLSKSGAPTFLGKSPGADMTLKSGEAIFYNDPATGWRVQRTEGLTDQAALNRFGPRLQTLYQRDEPTKTTIRRLTGQRDLSPEVKLTERQALKEQLKTAARAARTAFRAGDKEGVARERQRMKDLVARTTQRRKRAESVKSLRAQIKRVLKTTRVKKQNGKPVGKFTPEIQEVLDRLREISKLSKDEAEGRLIENLSRYEDELPPPEVVLENRLLEAQARVDTMDDPEALRDLLEDIKALKRTGRAAREAKDQARKIRNEEARERTIEELGGLPPDLRAVGIKDFTPRSRSERARRYLHTLGKKLVGWNDVLDILSAKSKTRPGESFISKHNDILGAKTAEKRGSRVAMQAVHDIYREAYGLESNRQMLKRVHEDNSEELVLRDLPFVDIEGRPAPKDLRFTRAELRKRAMELMDPSLDPTFEHMGYTEGVRAEIFERLTPQDEEFIRRQLAWYREYYAGVNETYREMYGVNLPKNEFYSPIAREGVAKKEDGLGEFMREQVFRASAATAGSLKSRVGSVKTLGKQSDIAVLQRHIAEMEHFKAWAQRIRDLNAVWKDPQVRAAVQIHHGRDMLALLDNFISDIADGGPRNAHKLEGLDRFRVNYTKAALGVRPSIMIKQLTSFVAYADAMPVTQFMKYHLKFWKNPVANAKEILETSELMKDRGGNIDRDLKAAMQTEEFSAFTKHQSFINMLLLNVKIGDQGAIIMGGWPLYKYLQDQGMSKAEALAEFERVTETTQQSGDIDQQSYWQRGGTLAKLTSMFASSPNQYLRKELAAIRNFAARRQGAAKTLKTLMIYHVVLPMFFQFVSDRFTWDEDEQKRALFLGPLNGWFLMGDALDWLLRDALGMQKFDMELPVFSVFHDAVKMAPLVDLFDLTADEFFRAMRALGGVTGAATGLPIKQAVEATKAATDIMQGEYEQGIAEMMGYSPYVAEEAARR